MESVTMAAEQAYMNERASYTQYLQQGSTETSGQRHEMATTPLFSLMAKHEAQYQMQQLVCGNQPGASTGNGEILPQYGLLGLNIGDVVGIRDNEPILLNTNAPTSTLICGSQGSGKSYTLSAMLENLLCPKTAPGKPGNPVAGVVFHYDVDSAGSVAEAASIASLGVKVDVLVSRSNEHKLRAAYTKELANSPNLRVRPLQLRSKDLSIERMNKLMAFSDQDGKVPLYMEVIQRILREMAIASQGADFNYTTFRNELDEVSAGFTREQINPMRLRLALLESFMVADARKTNNKTPLLDLQPGSLSIIDLSDPFVDASTVCLLFEICLSLVKENAPPSGLVVALDEAHKYMNKSLAATSFTDRLLTTIREQRHNSTRIIISTQEPTLSEKLLDLCSITIVHRFTSPAWFAAIKNHLGGASSWCVDMEGQKRMMDEIISLDTGMSLVFSPGSFVLSHEGRARKLGPGLLKMKTRLRGGNDGGKSKMATATKAGGEARGHAHGFGGASGSVNGSVNGTVANGSMNGMARTGMGGSMWSR